MNWGQLNSPSRKDKNLAWSEPITNWWTVKRSRIPFTIRKRIDHQLSYQKQQKYIKWDDKASVKMIPSQSKMKVSTESMSSSGFLRGCAEARVTSLEVEFSILEFLWFHLMGLKELLYNGFGMYVKFLQSRCLELEKRAVAEETAATLQMLLLSIVCCFSVFDQLLSFEGVLARKCPDYWEWVRWTWGR